MNILLIVLQWLLVLWGILLVAIALNSFGWEYRYFSDLDAAVAGGNSYNPPIFHRLATGVGTGLCAIGLGAVLFYLRRLYLARAVEQIDKLG